MIKKGVNGCYLRGKGCLVEGMGKKARGREGKESKLK
jgi:hypothetical protein